MIQGSPTRWPIAFSRCLRSGKIATGNRNATFRLLETNVCVPRCERRCFVVVPHDRVSYAFPSTRSRKKGSIGAVHTVGSEQRRSSTRARKPCDAERGTLISVPTRVISRFESGTSPLSLLLYTFLSLLLYTRMYRNS